MANLWLEIRNKLNTTCIYFLIIAYKTKNKIAGKVCKKIN